MTRDARHVYNTDKGQRSIYNSEDAPTTKEAPINIRCYVRTPTLAGEVTTSQLSRAGVKTLVAVLLVGTAHLQ